MTTTSHRDCLHPATKAARTACRKDRAAQVTALDSLINSYYDGTDIEVIAAQVPRHLAQGYYDGSLDAEEFIASLRA